MVFHWTGGGEGMGAIEKNIQALADQVGPACQVVAICGRNKALIKRLEAKQFPAGMQVCMLQQTLSAKVKGRQIHAFRLYLQCQQPCSLPLPACFLQCNVPLLGA